MRTTPLTTNRQPQLGETGTHKSAKTHAGKNPAWLMYAAAAILRSDIVTLTYDLLTLK